MSFIRRRGGSLAVVAAVAMMAAGSSALSAVNPSPPTEAAGQPGGPASGTGSAFAHGADAVARLGDQLPEVAMKNGMAASRLESLFLHDPTLGVSAEGGRLAYFELLEDPDPATTEPVQAEMSAAPPTTAPEFQLESNPGAAKTIYLDFTGHVTEGTWWNYDYGKDTITSPPFDANGDPNSWDEGELIVIRESWAATAEDFSPFDINVTTKDPGVEALRKSGDGDNEWGTRVVITRNNFSGCGCSGQAYVGDFGSSLDEPAFVYSSNYRRLHGVISHEVGHTLGLKHDGTTSKAYYGGHAAGDGAPGWGPLMGASGNRQVTHWSQQEYTNANNTGPDANAGRGDDDIAIIASLTNGNKFGFRPDDHGDDFASATPLGESGATVSGIINTRTDVDAFRFTMDAGEVSLTARPASHRPNLDIELIIRDQDGSVVASASPDVDLGAALNVSLPAGSYTAEIDGVGAGNPKASPPTGYTDYGSLGQFTLTATLPLIAPDLQAPNAPTGLAATVVDGQASLSWDANGESDLAGYIVRRSSSPGGPYTDLANQGGVSYLDINPSAGTNYYVVAAVDTSGNVSTVSSEASAALPLAPRSISGETAVTGIVSGSFQATMSKDGNVQSLTEVESGGRPANRHDQAEHRWTIPVDPGNQSLEVAAAVADGGDADQGFALEWSRDGSTWQPVAVVTENSPVEGSFALGQATGSIQVRVIDTNRARGERLPDTVEIDLLQVVSDGGNDEPPTSDKALATISTSSQGAGRGSHHGVATVQVTDERGGTVAGAAVTIRFTGDFSETATGTTDGSGLVRFQTESALKKPSFDACVVMVDAPGRTYLAGRDAC